MREEGREKREERREEREERREKREERREESTALVSHQAPQRTAARGHT